MKISELEPKEMWSYFDEITKIPRPSRHEDKMIQYLLDFAAKHKLEAEKDKFGNVVIRKPASKGFENVKSAILQGHSDMVCEKNSDIVHDFENDPIDAYIDGDWIKARGTTLGADDGIGIAAALAVLASKKIKHGPIEALFTSDEETGMTGAFGIKEGFVKSTILLNLDSEDDGELFIGCAGGIDTEATFKFGKRKVSRHAKAFTISVTGLKGGHSGDEIDKGLGNSNKILTRILLEIEKLKPRITDFNGGNLRNAIPREAVAKIILPTENTEKFKTVFKKISDEIKIELSVNEPNLKIEFQTNDLPDFIIDRRTQKRLLRALNACPHGVFQMSADMPGLVETSTNLASVKFNSKNKIIIGTSQRSASKSAILDIAQTVGSVFELAGAKIKRGEGYPGWKPNVNSEILKITKDAHVRVLKFEPKVRAIHAGLECGLFLQKYPYLDMISFGPTIKGAHSPDEKLNIPASQRFWDLLIEVLKNIPKEND
jgi:dipeptidase D